MTLSTWGRPKERGHDPLGLTETGGRSVPLRPGQAEGEAEGEEAGEAKGAVVRAFASTASTASRPWDQLRGLQLGF